MLRALAAVAASAAGYGGVPMAVNEVVYASAVEAGSASALGASGLPSAARSNPALYSECRRPSASLMAANLATFASGGHLAVVFPMGRLAWGANATAVVGDRFFDGRLSAAQASFRGNKAVLAPGAALSLSDRVSAGLSIKVVGLLAPDGAARTGVSADVGVRARALPWLSTSLALESAPPLLVRHGAAQDRFPTRVRAGVAAAGRSTRAGAELAYEPSLRSSRAAFGAEASFGPARLRAGILLEELRASPDAPALRGVRYSAGAGYEVGSYSVDGALLSHAGQPGVTLFMSVALRFRAEDAASGPSGRAETLAREARSLFHAREYDTAARVAERVAMEASDPRVRESAAALALSARQAAESELSELLMQSEGELSAGRIAEALLILQAAAARGILPAEAESARVIWQERLAAARRAYLAAADGSLADGRPLEAMLAAQSALTLDPDDPEAQGKRELARRQLSGLLAASVEIRRRGQAQAASTGPPDPARRRRLDEALLRAERAFSTVRYTECLRELQLLLADDPGNQRALELYERALDRLGAR